MEIEKIHIGDVIKAEVLRQNKTFAAFAKSIGVLRQNIDNKVFSKKGIDTELLCVISKELGVNFFKYYVPDNEKNTICNENKLREGFIKEIKAYLTLEIAGKKEQKEETFVFTFGKQDFNE